MLALLPTSDAFAQNSSNEPDTRILAMLRRAEPAALALVAIVAVATLGLWFTPGLAVLAPALWSKMVANTAVGLLLAVAGLAASQARQSAALLGLSRAAGLTLFVLGVMTLAEYATDTSLGIDTWFPTAAGSHYPGRPSPQTALALALLGASILTIREYKSRLSHIADLSTISLAALCLVLIGGQLFHATSLTGINASTLVSPQTILSLSCLSFVVVARRSQRGGIFSVLVNIGIGSQIVRAVVPIAILLPYASIGAVAYLIESQTMGASNASALASAGETLAALSVVIWMAWRINALERQLRDLSLTDELTKVNNRRGFYLLAKQAFREVVRARSSLTIMFFDLDGLKRANDTIGHDAGSELIQALATLLMQTFRDSDIVGRVGGDEFAVVGLCDGRNAREALARLNKAVAAFNASAVQKFPLSFSVGMAEMTPGGPESLEDLVATADARMYENKALSKSRASRPRAEVNPPLIAGAEPASADATRRVETSADPKVAQSA
jgi:diguanylate cyclase (GGDEF)-like protein